MLKNNHKNFSLKFNSTVKFNLAVKEQTGIFYKNNHYRSIK